MLGQLDIIQIEQLLTREVVGRIGCSDGENVYVVPISYAYDGEYIYCHTHEGKKIHIMRAHPAVCFEVDHLQDMANWQSVVAHGAFEELKQPDLRNMALQRLHARVLPLVSSETTHLSKDWPFEPSEPDKITGVTFRVRLKDKSGRFEISEGLPQPSYVM